MRRNQLREWSVLCVVLVIGTASCGIPGDRRDDGRKHVVTTFTVLADMTREVAGDTVAIESITKPGTEVHAYEPTPSDLLKSAKADVILDNGLGLESWFDQFVHDAEAPHVTLSSGVQPIPVRSGGQRGAANPHAWMSPRNAAHYVANIRDALIRMAPEHAELFRANAADYIRRIDDVGRSLRRSLADLPKQRRALVTCEGAFSYLARDAGLREEYLWPVNSEQEGTPRQVKNATRFVENNGIPTVFCESTVNDEAQRQVAEETRAKLGSPLYVDSLSDPDGPVPTYLALLHHDADAIADGLTGAQR